MVLVCWVCAVPPASVRPTVRLHSDAVPADGKGCAYRAHRPYLVSFYCPGTPKMSSYSSHAETPTGLPDDLARWSWIKVKTSLKCWFGMVSMQRQQETSRHLICALAVASFHLLQLFGCWNPLSSLLSKRRLVMCLWAAHLENKLFWASWPRDRLKGFCYMAKPLLGVWDTLGLHELFLSREGWKAAASGQGHGCGRRCSPCPALVHLCQPVTTAARPLHEGGWAPVPNLPLRILWCCKELGFDFGGKGGEQPRGTRLSPAPLLFPTCRCWRSLQIKGRGILRGGRLPKCSAVQLTGCKH